jgi:hypothetical protein
MDAGNHRRAEANRTVAVALDQAGIAVSEAENLVHTVAVPQTQQPVVKVPNWHQPGLGRVWCARKT